MADEPRFHGISNGPNSRPLEDTVAGTGPGIPDDALAPGEDALPEPPSDEMVKAVADKLGAKLPPER